MLFTEKLSFDNKIFDKELKWIKFLFFK